MWLGGQLQKDSATIYKNPEKLKLPSCSFHHRAGQVGLPGRCSQASPVPSLCMAHLCSIKGPLFSLFEIHTFGLLLFLQARLHSICFLCPIYFIYYNILHFHLFSHKWQDFWLASWIVLLSTFCLSVHPSMHTAIESFPWLLCNKHGVHEPLLHWFHLVWFNTW